MEQPAGYYTVSNTSLNSALNNAEYARYKLYISTNTATVTPDLSGVNFTYSSRMYAPRAGILQRIVGRQQLYDNGFGDRIHDEAFRIHTRSSSTWQEGRCVTLTLLADFLFPMR